MDLAPVYVEPHAVRVLYTGLVHLEYVVGGRKTSDIRCQLPDSTQPITLAEMSESDEKALCLFCFPH